MFSQIVAFALAASQFLPISLGGRRRRRKRKEKKKQATLVGDVFEETRAFLFRLEKKNSLEFRYEKR